MDVQTLIYQFEEFIIVKCLTWQTYLTRLGSRERISFKVPAANGLVVPRGLKNVTGMTLTR